MATKRWSQTRSKNPLLAIVTPLLAIGLLAGSGTARSDTFVFAHALEVTGKISDTQHTFDTTIFATYTADLADPGKPSGQANVDVYVFDQQTGLPMTASGGAEVANPLSFTLDANQRTRKIVLDDLIVAAGGFDVSKKSGFIVIDVGGDKKNVTVRGLLQWTGATPNDLSQTVLPVGPDIKGKRALFVPFQETPGHPGQFPACIDTVLSIVDVGGIGHSRKTKKRGAQVNLFLFDDSTGRALRSPGGNDVCNPCSFAMGTGAANDAAPRKRLITIEDLIVESGGFSTGVKTGFAVIALEGDADNVNITSAVVNAKSSALDLSIFVFEPLPIPAL